MDDVDYTSTTTMTSVTEDTDEDFSGAGHVQMRQEEDGSSAVTVSDTNDETLVDTAVLISPAHAEEDVIKMEVAADTQGADVKGESTEEQKENGQSQGKFQLPDFNAGQGQWYQHDCFKHYWQHYQFVSLWCEKHMEVYKTVRQQYTKALSASLSSSTLQQPENTSSQRVEHEFKKPVSRRTQRNRKARQRRKAARKRMKMAVNYSGSTDNGSSLSEKEEGDTTDVQMDDESSDSLVEVSAEVQMEISEEMLDFFAHTHKHRLEREARKKSEKTKKEETLVNIEEVRSDQKERTVEAPREQPGSRRTAEMRLLYGKGAAMIHGMETALQMNFDRNLDVRQPKPWPNMPFKVIFDR